MRVEQHPAAAWDEFGRTCWDSVVRRMPSAAPFLSTVWTNSWLRVFASHLTPVQLRVIDASGEVIGTCLLTSRVRRQAVLPHVRLYLNTDGENAGDSVIIEHNALLAAAGANDTVAQAIARHVAGMRVDELRVMGAGEAEVARLQQAFAGWEADIEWREAPFIDLNKLRSTGCTHLDVLSRNTREQLRRSIARYERRGEIVVEVARTVKDAEVMFAELVRLHEARWAYVRCAGAFASTLRLTFHHAFLRDGVPLGSAQLLRVSVNGETIAVLYFLAANGRVNFYQSGLRHESDKHLKPGMTAHHFAIQYYLEQGYAEYDFLSSPPNEIRYKASLASDARRLASLTLRRPGWRGQYFRGVRRLRRMFWYARRYAVQGERA
jgi:CelD/BcsL family acetyltransferase involved in cellulose biosynthesis